MVLVLLGKHLVGQACGLARWRGGADGVHLAFTIVWDSTLASIPSDDGGAARLSLGCWRSCFGRRDWTTLTLCSSSKSPRVIELVGGMGGFGADGRRGWMRYWTRGVEDGAAGLPVEGGADACIAASRRRLF